MPKKWQGGNSKAVEAKARKSAQRAADDEEKKQREEDEYWRDDDKNVAKKLQRRDEKDQKKQELYARKLANKALLEQEEGGSSSTTQSYKVTQHDIAVHQERLQAEQQKELERQRLEASRIVVDSGKLEENVNRLVVDGEEARTVDEALLVLGGSKEADKGSEKNLKAAYAAYEEKNLPLLKAENPNLRLSQLKQMLKQDWLKAPENPMNQRT